jgi:hypothetical protein
MRALKYALPAVSAIRRSLLLGTTTSTVTPQRRQTERDEHRLVRDERRCGNEHALLRSVQHLDPEVLDEIGGVGGTVGYHLKVAEPCGVWGRQEPRLVQQFIP